MKESEKADLKLNIQKTKIMASSPITSWEIGGETVETVTTLFWGAPKSLQMVTAAMKLRHLLLGRKAMINLDSILKSRDITLTTNVHLVKAVVFPVVTYGCESQTIKKAECQRINAFELRCWMTFESPLGCKEVHQVHPKGYQSWMFIERTDAEA